MEEEKRGGLGQKTGRRAAVEEDEEEDDEEKEEEEEEEEKEDEREPIPVARAVYDMGWRPFGCWDCGFESRRALEYLSLVIVVCCRLEFSATGRSLVKRDPTENVSFSVIKCKQQPSARSMSR